MEPISLAPDQIDPNAQPISLDQEQSQYLISPELVKNRAMKTKMAVSGTDADLPRDYITDNIARGNEQQLRQEISSKMLAVESQKRSDLVLKAISDKGGPLSQDDLKWIDGTNPSPYFNPDTVTEWSYADKVVNYLDTFAQTQGSDNFWNTAKNVVPSDVEAAKRWGNITLAQREIMLRMAQEINTQIEGQNAGQKTIDWLALNAVPFRYNIGVRGNVDTGMMEGGTTAANLELQRNRLLALPFPEFVEKLKQVTADLSAQNPQLALMFLTQMMGQSSSDRFLNTINDIFDASLLPGVLKVGARGFKVGRAIKEVHDAIKDVVRAAPSNPEETKAAIMASVGDVKAAAVELAGKDVAKKIEGTFTNPTEAGLNTLPRHLEQMREDIKTNPGQLADGFRDILVEDFAKTESRTLQVLTEMMKVERLPLEDLTAAERALVARTVVDRYPGISNRVMNVGEPFREPLSNTYWVPFSVGKKPGELFRSPTEVKNFLRANGITDAKIERQGVGYYFTVNRPVKETETAIGDLIAGEKVTRESAKLPDVENNYLNLIPLFQHARTAEDTMSAVARANRKAAVYPQALLRALAHEEAKLLSTTPGIGAIKRKEWTQLKRILEENQRTFDHTTERKGVYFKDVKELEDNYQKIFGRLPSFAETRAYFAVVRMTEIDRILREVNLFRNQARLGAETIQIVSSDAAGQTIKSPAFSAIPRDKLPGGSGTVLIMGDVVEGSLIVELEELVGETLAKGQAKSLERLNTAQKAAYLEDIRTGKIKLYEIYDEEQRPLNGFVTDGHYRIRYVIAKNVESKALDWAQVPRLGGGHFEYNYSHYVKQAIVNQERIGGTAGAGGTLKTWYEGDRTVMPIAYKSLGSDLVKDMNQVRTLLKDGKTAEAEAHARATLPGDMVDDFIGHFYEKRGPNGEVILPMLNLNEAFHVVPRSRSIIDIDQGLRHKYGNSFQDGTRQGLARNFQVEYTGERDSRDLFTVQNKGTRAQPLYHVQDAELLDPISAMNRGLNRIINTTALEDYKIFAVESWIKEAQPWLKADPSELRSSPFFHFHTAGRSDFIPGVPLEKFNQLMANRFKINQLLHTQTETDRFIHRVAQDLADSVYQRDPALADRLVKITPTHLLPTLRDPVGFMRSITFNAYLGLFAVPQMFVQNMTFVNIFAITPKYAVQGTMGAFFHQMSRINKNPAILDKFDEIASKIGSWKPGQWKEAMRELDKTGFATVAGEYGPLDSLRSAKIIRNGADNFLYAGQTFFREGERNVRYGAWYTAFKEWRDLNPVGKISNADRIKILDRADFLYGNMSNASNSVLHSGILSLPTQFYSYSIRLAEQFLGKRLAPTLAKRNMIRARIVATNAMMFGVPLAFGTAGLPLTQTLRQDMMSSAGELSNLNPIKWARTLTGHQPYEPNKKNKDTGDWLETMFMEGIPATMLALATGKYYNVGPRYGSQGFEQIKEMLAGDAPFWKIALGASYTLGSNFFNKSLAGFYGLMTAIGRGDPSKFPVVPEDAIDLLRETYAGNRGYSTWQAINTGKWVNKNSDFIDNVSWKDALFRFTTGLSPTEQNDIWTKRLTMKDRKESQTWNEKQFMTEMNRGFLAQSGNNPSQAEKYFTRAMLWLSSADLNTDETAAWLGRATKGQWSLINRINWDYYIRTAPASQQKKLLDAYQKIQRQ